MRSQASGRLWLGTVLMTAAIMLATPARSPAQRPGGGFDSPTGHSATSTNPDNVSYKSSKAEPYGGQIYCPVTGKKLGLTQPPVPVQTTIGETQPGFWGKVFGQKPTPGVVIYVCSPECAEPVRKNPQMYLGEVVADKASFSFTYAQAPAQRPARVGEGQSPGTGQQESANTPKPAIVPVAGQGNAPPH
jgi:hypothetical protein